jgi:hypothetical protein
VEQGGILEIHDNIPSNMREQLYVEERQRLLKQNKSTSSLTSGTMLPQININVLPLQSSQPAGSSWAALSFPVLSDRTASLPLRPWPVFIATYCYSFVNLPHSLCGSSVEIGSLTICLPVSTPSFVVLNRSHLALQIHPTDVLCLDGDTCADVSRLPLKSTK